MKCLVLLLGFIAAARADQCDNSFGAYLNALKDQVSPDDATAANLENENKNDYLKLIHQCFGAGNQCSLGDDELNGDIYGDSGPMHGCSKCQQFARGLRDKFMNSPESVRKCFRMQFAEAVRQELQPCIQGKLNDFNFQTPSVPDFDERTFHNIDTVEKTLAYHILARSRMDVCKTKNPSGYSNTQPCMQNEYPGIFKQHCQAAKNAKAKAITSDCQSRFQAVKSATCQCMVEKRDEWHKKFDDIMSYITSMTTPPETSVTCGAKIHDTLGNWLDKVQTAMSTCLPAGDDSKTRNLQTMIELGCGQVLSGNVQQGDLVIGFRFVRYLLDGLNDRILVFCDQRCNF